MRKLAIVLVTLGCSSAAGPVEQANGANPTVPTSTPLVSFAPGRYAGVTHMGAEGGCSRTRVWTSSSSAVVMSFQPDGTVSACRALRYRDHYVSMSVEDRSSGEYGIDEQQGLSGHYHRRDAWLDITLDVDDSVCPPKQAGATVYAKRAWRLECLSSTIPGVTNAALVCRFADEPHSTEAYTVGGLAGEPEKRWLVLASGNGVVVKADNQWNVGMGRWQSTAHDASSPLRGDAWPLLDTGN